MSNRLFRLCAILLCLLAGAQDAPLDPAPPAPVPVPVAPTAPPSGATSFASGAAVAVIPVHGMIHDFTFESLRRRTDDAIANGATLIVYEIDTYGGHVESAMAISKYLKQVPRPTLAWINNKAYSAGIMIAAAADAIVMSPVSATGDCAPIAPGHNLSPTERAKLLSPILAEFRDSAREHGYDYVLFHAMCELGVEVYQVEHVKTGERRLVNQADYRVMVKSEPMTPIDASSPVNYALARTEEAGQWKLVSHVHDGKTLLTLHQHQAYDVGLSKNDPAKDPIASDSDLRHYLAAASLTRINQHWIIDVAYFLVNPWVRGVLIIVFLLGAYIEAQMPGIGVAGVASIAALIILLGAPYLVGLAEVWHLILFILGLVLLAVEVFMFPGFGVAGVAGILCMFVGLILMIVPSTGQGWLPLPARGMGAVLRESVFWSLIAMIGSAVGFYFITRHMGQIPMMNRLILRDPPANLIQTEDGRTIQVQPPRMHVSGEEAIGSGAIAVGDAGKAVTALRPTGRADIAGQIVDVIAVAGWIEPGTRLKVVEVQGNRIVVDAES